MNPERQIQWEMDARPCDGYYMGLSRAKDIIAEWRASTGATPEPRWVQVMRAEVAETKHFKVGSVAHLYEMAVAFYDEFARAALRAPEPLTAEPDAWMVELVEDGQVTASWPTKRKPFNPEANGYRLTPLYASAALEGGVIKNQH